MKDMTEERVCKQIANSDGVWTKCSESQAKYLQYELSYYKPVFREESPYAEYYSLDCRPLRIVYAEDLKSFIVEQL